MMNAPSLPLCFALFLVFALTGVLTTEAVAEEASAQRPNVIVIMCDDMGYEGVSAYGSPSYKTPNLDRLAAEGVRFNHCYSQPICTPSRVQIMTGKYNFQNYTKFGKLRTTEVTFGNVMKRLGYATAIAGKWQLGGDAKTVRDFGFDTHCLWHLDGRDSRFWNPRISQNGKLLPGLEKQYGPDIMCQFLTDFIAEHAESKPEQPFFIYWPTVLVHWPFVPTPDSPEGGSRQRIGKYDGQNGGVEYFDDMVAYMDKLIGKLVDQLEASNVRDNTLLLFTGDNGCATNIVSKMGSSEIHGGKGAMPDAGTHVAMVASGPGLIRGGRVINDLVDFTDILPTIAEVGGAKGVKQQLKLDGQSFLPQLQGEAGTPREWVFCHYTRNGHPTRPKNEAAVKKALQKQQQARKKKQLGRFARNQRYKLYDDGRFYDVQRDVLEQSAIAPGTGSDEAERVRNMLQDVHESMPAWTPFAAAKAK